MKQNKIKQNYFKKSLPIFLLVLLCFSFLITPQKAKAWDAIEGALFKQALENLQKTIDGISLAAAKQAAMTMLLEEIDKMFQDFYDAGEGIITDWEDYLVGTPERESTAFMNDLLSDITQGRSSTRYRSVPVATTLSYAEAYEGFGAKNAVQFALIKSAQAEEDGSTTTESSYNTYIENMNLIGMGIIENNYTSNLKLSYNKGVDEMFDDGTFKYLDVYLSNPVNTPWGFETILSYAKNEKTQEFKQIAETHASSSGFVGNETTPSAVLEAMATKSSTLGMDIISTAESLPEVISAAVINAINRSIQQGIGAIKSRIQREVTNVRRKITNSVNDEIDKYGPQAVFGNQTFYEQYTSN